MSVILEFMVRSILSIAFEAEIKISEVTVFSNSSVKLTKAMIDGIIRETETIEIHEMIIIVPSFNLNSAHSQTLIL